jgi:hypothetical protein
MTAGRQTPGAVVSGREAAGLTIKFLAGSIKRAPPPAAKCEKRG